MAYDNTNRGVLFKNSQKKTEKSPDYSGGLDVSGVKYTLVGWINTSKNGNEFITISVDPIGDKKQYAPKSPAEQQDVDTDFNDDIPFKIWSYKHGY